LWEREGEEEGIKAISETIPQQKGSAPHRKQVRLTSALAVGVVVRLRHTVLARESGRGREDAARAAERLGSLNRAEL
jgi:hypothetical protein